MISKRSRGGNDFDDSPCEEFRSIVAQVSERRFLQKRIIATCYPPNEYILLGAPIDLGKKSGLNTFSAFNPLSLGGVKHKTTLFNHLHPTLPRPLKKHASQAFTLFTVSSGQTGA